MTDANTSANAKRSDGRPLANFAWAALIFVILVVTSSGFALTFHGLLGYGTDLAKLAGFAWLVPVMVDGLTVVAIVVTFLLAYVRAPWRPRLYAWAVFAVANGSSIAGNSSYAAHRNLSMQGAVGAALCPVFVTLAAHLAIVCWKWWRVRPVAVPAARVPVPAVQLVPLPQIAAPIPVPVPVDTPPPAAAAEPTTEPDQPVPVRTPRRAEPRNTSRRRPAPPAVARNESKDPRKAKARELFAAGIGRGEILAQFNGDAPTRKTVENWTRDLDAVHAQAKAARAQAAGGGQR